MTVEEFREYNFPNKALRLTNSSNTAFKYPTKRYESISGNLFGFCGRKEIIKIDKLYRSFVRRYVNNKYEYVWIPKLEFQLCMKNEKRTFDTFGQCGFLCVIEEV